MTPEQRELLERASDSLEAAKLLRSQGFVAFSASRAYYSMFYVAEALLLRKGLSFSRHAGVHRGFAQHFVKPGLVRSEFHDYLTRGMEVRHAGDYAKGPDVTEKQADLQLARAQEFLEMGRRMLADERS